MHVAVIGGSGFIGSRLVGALLETGAEVTVLDLEPPPATLEGCCRSYQVDIAAPGALGSFLADVDAVFLTAARLAKLCAEDPVGGWAVNSTGVRNVVAALAASRRCPRVIFTSSGSVYRSPAPTYPTPESAPLEASDTYTGAKIDAERTLERAAHRGLLSAVVLRPFTVYGPGPASGARGHLVADWIERALAGQPLVVHGDGRQTVDLTHVDDLVRAGLAALGLATRFCVLNVGSGTETTLLELACWMHAVVPTVEAVRAPARGGRRRQFADIALAAQLLGWRPRILPRDGITELLRSRAEATAFAPNAL
jgi:nucleoside-diphosphate-sugar epimerase